MDNCSADCTNHDVSDRGLENNNIPTSFDNKIYRVREKAKNSHSVIDNSSHKNRVLCSMRGM